MTGPIALLIDMSLLVMRWPVSISSDEVDLTDALVILTGQSTFRIELARLENSAHKKLLVTFGITARKNWKTHHCHDTKNWSIEHFPEMSTAQCVYPVPGYSGTFASTKDEGFWSLLASCSLKQVILSALQVFLIFLAMLGCCFLIYEMNLVFRVVEVFEHLLDILLEFARCLRMNSDSAWDGRGSGVAKWLGDQARLHSAGLSTCLGPHQEVGFALGKGTWWDLTRADRSTLRC